MSIYASYEKDEIEVSSKFEFCDQYSAMWFGRSVCQKSFSALSIKLPNVNHSTTHMQNLQGKVKPMGEGSYEVEVEKDSDGTTTVSGSVTYETDGGVSVEAEVKVDSDGNSSGSVSLSGKF